jgi:hypothetical protein
MVTKGDRVKITGVMADDPAPMEVGTEGTVDYVHDGGGGIGKQISVKWDNGRSLFLLPHDPFVVISRANQGEAK